MTDLDDRTNVRFSVPQMVTVIAHTSADSISGTGTVASSGSGTNRAANGTVTVAGVLSVDAAFV